MRDEEVVEAPDELGRRWRMANPVPGARVVAGPAMAFPRWLLALAIVGAAAAIGALIGVAAGWWTP